MSEVPPAHLVGDVGVDPLERVLAHRREHPQPARLAFAGREPSRRGRAAAERAGADRLQRLGLEAAGEDAERGEDASLVPRAAPRSTRSRLVSVCCRSGRSRESARGEVEPGRAQELGERQVACAGGDELERERQAVEAAAQLVDARPGHEPVAGGLARSRNSIDASSAASGGTG